MWLMGEAQARIFILLLLTTLARDVGDLGSAENGRMDQADMDRQLGL